MRAKIEQSRLGQNLIVIAWLTDGFQQPIAKLAWSFEPDTITFSRSVNLFFFYLSGILARGHTVAPVIGMVDSVIATHYSARE
jgi:hypothetical protein